MSKVKITLSYDGSRFSGFQIQRNDHKIVTVAGHITKALEKINIDSILTGSGRTDAGVHAMAQVAHCKIPSYWSDYEKLKNKLNYMLAPSVYIKKIEAAPESFNSRFSAYKRLYRYVLYTGTYNPFYAQHALHVENLDTKKLNIILKKFIGIHDFKYFKKTGSTTQTDVREIFKAGAYEYKNFTIIYFLGNSFLRSQVRMMNNFALKVMNEQLSSEQLEEQLHTVKKHNTSLVPPVGLYLAKIYY